MSTSHAAQPSAAAHRESTQPPDEPDPTLTAEHDHLHEARAALAWMRQRAAALRDSHVAGDWVSAEYLDSTYELRLRQLADHPTAPLFFGRLDYLPGHGPDEENPNAGAPGTGKTAVGLHRAAYLLYAHRDQLQRQRLLVIGPNDVFLRYIGDVLPALGEVDARQLTVAALTADVPVRGTDPPAVATLKGDARLAEVLRRAAWSHLTEPTEALVVPRGSRRFRIPAHEAAEIVAGIRDRGVRYQAGRAMLPQRLAHGILVRMENAGDSPDDRVQNAIARSKPVRAYADPEVDPTETITAHVVAALREAVDRPGSVGLIAADDQIDSLRAVLTAAGIAHVGLGEEGDVDARLDVVPASLAKGLKFDHVVAVEPAEIVAAEPDEATGLRRLYVCLTRAVSSLSVVHAKPLPEPLRRTEPSKEAP